MQTGRHLVPGWFISSIADYVADINKDDRDNSIEWLMRTDFGQVCRREGDKLTFIVVTVEKR